VENDPAPVINGKIRSSIAAFRKVLKAMEAAPKKLPARPPDPVKRRSAKLYCRRVRRKILIELAPGNISAAR